MIAKLGKGIALVGGVTEGKVTLIVRVSKELVGQYKAGEIIKPLAEKIGGSGGGRPDMAQAGGPNIEKLDEVLQTFYDLV